MSLIRAPGSKEEKENSFELKETIPQTTHRSNTCCSRFFDGINRFFQPRQIQLEQVQLEQVQRQKVQPPQKVMNILILDLDSCALTNITHEQKINTRADRISPHLIEHVKSSQYDAFYVCTHRNSHTVFQAALSEDYLSTYGMVSLSLDPKNLLMTMIIPNLEKALGIDCLAVSTPDDFGSERPKNPLEQCGYGFERIIKPYEEKLISINQHLILQKKYSGYENVKGEESWQSISDGMFPYDYYSKNNQLILVAQHASMRFLNTQINLYYRDDMKEICVSAQSVHPNMLASNITLFIINDDPFYGVLKDMGFVKGSAPVSVISSLEEQDYLSPRFVK